MKDHKEFAGRLRKSWELYLLVLPAVIYVLIFHYWPMYGAQIAFKTFSAVKGITGSDWSGVNHFVRFFNSYDFGRVLKNTLLISLFQLIFAFPTSIILALLMNEVKNKAFKRSMQTITYIPHFLSTVVLVSMLTSFLSPTAGAVNSIRTQLGLEVIEFMTDPDWFRPLYVMSGIWQNAGWGSIIYMAAIVGIGQELYEAAIVDGANKIKQLIHITLPGIAPVIIIMLIMEVGRMMSVGFDKTFLMQNQLTLDSSEVISTYVYKTGLLQGRYDYAAAIGLFNSVINFTLLVTVNKLSRRISGNGLW